jgi:hypothetical protein
MLNQQMHKCCELSHSVHSRILFTSSMFQTNAHYRFATADSFNQVYEAVPEDGVQHTETCSTDLVKNICSKYLMCIWLE